MPTLFRCLRRLSQSAASDIAVPRVTDCLRDVTAAADARYAMPGQARRDA